jgi:hypothetical protein
MFWKFPKGGIVFTNNLHEVSWIKVSARSLFPLQNVKIYWGVKEQSALSVNKRAGTPSQSWSLLLSMLTIAILHLRVTSLYCKVLHCYAPEIKIYLIFSDFTAEAYNNQCRYRIYFISTPAENKPVILEKLCRISNKKSIKHADGSRLWKDPFGLELNGLLWKDLWKDLFGLKVLRPQVTPIPHSSQLWCHPP